MDRPLILKRKTGERRIVLGGAQQYLLFRMYLHALDRRHVDR